jgi:hypothetical protein
MSTVRWGPVELKVTFEQGPDGPEMNVLESTGDEVEYVLHVLEGGGDDQVSDHLVDVKVPATVTVYAVDEECMTDCGIEYDSYIEIEKIIDADGKKVES